MRILLNDFGGYPFPIELSRNLAENGDTVLHCYLSNIKTPHGSINKRLNDPESFFIKPILLKKEFKKYSPMGRYLGELEYATKVKEQIELFKPDIFLSANTPLIAQNKLLKICKKENITFIYWCQDIHSIALKKFFSKKLYLLGDLISLYFKKIEVKLLMSSDHIITISESFNLIFNNWGVAESKMTVIHNWGPLSEIKLLDKSNDWSRKFGFESKTIILYAGTLGFKHNPLLLINAAIALKNNEDVIFIVISEGLGADILREQKALHHLTNLILFPYQDYDILSDVLSSADVLVAILENEAGQFSVPSKVLTYLCAGKAILLAIPSDNLSSEIIIRNNAGLSVNPQNADEFILKLRALIENPELRNSLGENGRQYARANFSINAIAEKFKVVFDKVTTYSGSEVF